MVIKNHIAYRFLTDETLIKEMCETMYPEEWSKTKATFNSKKENIEFDDLDSKIASFVSLVSPSHQKPFYVTESVLKNLDLLKVSRSGPHFNWQVFKSLRPQKITLILPGDRVLRIRKQASGTLELFWLRFVKDKEPGKMIEGSMKWVMLYMNTDTGELCEHFDHVDGLESEEFLYKLLCFFYLTENIEEIIAPKSVHGTRKTGKTLNDFSFPLTVVTSKWNITSIRTEGFMVSGHFRLQPKGVGRSEYEMIFIEPFQKNGYKRTAGKKLIN